MIIILEGPDGAGKTTLAKKLTKQFKYPIIHEVAPKGTEDQFNMYFDTIRTVPNLIYDRCWYSEMVYGKIMRGRSAISSTQMYTLECMVAEKGGVIIYCTGQPRILWDRCQKRGEHFVTSKKRFERICREYDRIFFDYSHYIPIIVSTNVL